MDLNRIAIFVRVANAGSFTAAAQSLGVPKSSVSRAVAALEAELGVRLLQRTTRKLHLTDAGAHYVERARGAISELALANEAIGELGDSPRGSVRISAPFDLGDFLASAIKDFTQKYPHVHVDVSLSGRHVDLIAEGFDLALRGGPLRDSGLIARKLGDSMLALFAAPSYIKRRGRPRELEELGSHECILYRAPLGRTTWRLQGPRGEESVEVKGRASGDEMHFVVHAASLGMGIALLPATMAGKPFANENLVRVLPKYGLGGGGLHLVFPSARFLPARVSLLRDFLAERLKTGFLAGVAQR